jgi:hypothetical protein
MTLSEWDKNNPAAFLITDADAAGRVVYVLVRELPAEHVRELWHLDDYAVSSQTGMVIWLVPKQ